MSSLTDKLFDLEAAPAASRAEPASGSAPESNSAAGIQPGEGQVHRSVAALLVEGLGPEEIASRLRLEVGKVKTLLKQPHTQQAIRELVDGQESKSTENILKATEVDNVLRLIAIRDDPSTPAHVVVSACRTINEMQRGKKPYMKEDDGESLEGGDLSAKVAALDRQINERMKVSEASA